MLALSDPAQMNLNPFAEGDRLFPVDPTGRCQTLYESLLVFSPQSMDYVPVLAETVKLQNQTIAIRLPADKTWHDGFPLTGEDILFTIQAHERLETDLGLSLESLIQSMEIQEDDSILIQVREEETNGGIRCLEALARTLILPQHLWETLLDRLVTPDQLGDQNLPLVGSGAWVFCKEDEFALSFSLDQEVLAYVSILKYQAPLLARKALINQDLDLILFSHTFESLHDQTWQALLAEVDRDPLSLTCGEKLAGITLNPRGQDILGLRSFRQLLCLVADPTLTGPILMPTSPPISRADLLTIPCLGKQLDLDLILSTLGEGDEARLDQLMAESNLDRSGEGDWLEVEGQRLTALKLIYPLGSDQVEKACQTYKEAAKALGLNIRLQGLEEAAWRQAYETGSYDLIYTETAVNESPALLSERLLAIPGLGQDGFPSDQFDGNQGGYLIRSLGEARNNKEVLAGMEDLALWLAHEGLFIPLAAGEVEAGIWSLETGVKFDPLTIFPQGASLEVPDL